MILYWKRHWIRSAGRYVWKMYVGPRRITATVSLALLAGHVAGRL